MASLVSITPEVKAVIKPAHAVIEMGLKEIEASLVLLGKLIPNLEDGINVSSLHGTLEEAYTRLTGKAWEYSQYQLQMESSDLSSVQAYRINKVA
jgi:hypothetical protein